METTTSSTSNQKIASHEARLNFTRVVVLVVSLVYAILTYVIFGCGMIAVDYMLREVPYSRTYVAKLVLPGVNSVLAIATSLLHWELLSLLSILFACVDLAANAIWIGLTVHASTLVTPKYLPLEYAMLVFLSLLAFLSFVLLVGMIVLWFMLRQDRNRRQNLKNKHIYAYYGDCCWSL